MALGSRPSVEALRHGSIVAWQHINLHGEYDFSDDKLQDSVGLRVPKTLGLHGHEDPADKNAAMDAR